jgi:hypothetical protein
MNGKFLPKLEKKLVDNQQQYQWLNLDIQGKTESALSAATEKTEQKILKFQF